MAKFEGTSPSEFKSTDAYSQETDAALQMMADAQNAGETNPSPQEISADAPSQEKREEGELNTRQQDKIIKIVESENLDVLNQPLAAISADERNAFFEKVRTGEITEESLNSMVGHITAPFSGKDGIQKLHEKLQGDEQLQREVSDAIHSSLHDKNAVYRPDHRVSIEELERFAQKYPTPYAFDTTFIDNRRQELQAALKEAQVPFRRTMLEMDMVLQKQKESETYPHLRAALYGKREEYWKQGKLLLEKARNNKTESAENRAADEVGSTPPTPIDEENVPENNEGEHIVEDAREEVANGVSSLIPEAVAPDSETAAMTEKIKTHDTVLEAHTAEMAAMAKRIEAIEKIQDNRDTALEARAEKLGWEEKLRNLGRSYNALPKKYKFAISVALGGATFGSGLALGAGIAGSGIWAFLWASSRAAGPALTSLGKYVQYEASIRDAAEGEKRWWNKNEKMGTWIKNHPRAAAAAGAAAFTGGMFGAGFLGGRYITGHTLPWVKEHVGDWLTHSESGREVSGFFHNFGTRAWETLEATRNAALEQIKPPIAASIVVGDMLDKTVSNASAPSSMLEASSISVDTLHPKTTALLDASGTSRESSSKLPLQERLKNFFSPEKVDTPKMSYPESSTSRMSKPWTEMSNKERTNFLVNEKYPGGKLPDTQSLGDESIKHFNTVFPPAPEAVHPSPPSQGAVSGVKMGLKPFQMYPPGPEPNSLKPGEIHPYGWKLQQQGIEPASYNPNPHAPNDVIHGENLNDHQHAGAPAATHEHTATPEAPHAAIAHDPHLERAVVKGDNTWKILGTILKERAADPTIRHITLAHQNFILVALENQLRQMSPAELHEIGFHGNPPDINKIYPGNKLDFNKLFNKPGLMDKIMNDAQHLPAAHMAAIHQHVHPHGGVHTTHLHTHTSIPPLESKTIGIAPIDRHPESFYTHANPDELTPGDRRAMEAAMNRAWNSPSQQPPHIETYPPGYYQQPASYPYTMPWINYGGYGYGPTYYYGGSPIYSPLYAPDITHWHSGGHYPSSPYNIDTYTNTNISNTDIHNTNIQTTINEHAGTISNTTIENEKNFVPRTAAEVPHAWTQHTLVPVVDQYFGGRVPGSGSASQTWQQFNRVPAKDLSEAVSSKGIVDPAAAASLGISPQDALKAHQVMQTVQQGTQGYVPRQVLAPQSRESVHGFVERLVNTGIARSAQAHAAAAQIMHAPPHK